MLLDIALFIDSKAICGQIDAIDEIYKMLETIRQNFSFHYDRCLRMHPHPKILYERGMLKLHSGDTEEALADIEQFSAMAKSDQYKDQIVMTSEMYQQEGQAYADLGMYDKAIAALTESIKRDPENKEAYFGRAAAYFETGEFEKALSDYLISEKNKNLVKIKPRFSSDFKDALLNGLLEGGKESTLEFFPSLLHSTQGATESLWAFVCHPIGSTTNFCNACYDISAYTANFFKKLDWDQIDGYSEELRKLCDQFDNMTPAEKGHLTGYIIGKYGVDIFIGGTAIKGVALFKNLKNANRICNLETMSSSLSHREALLVSSARYAQEREVFFKNVKINWDRQNKHILGKHNYEQGKSIFEHKDPQSLLEKFAGKGRAMNNEKPGSPNYRELVDFGEHIGIWKNQEQTLSLPTTHGTIRYSKDGAHIIPAYPN